MKGAPPGRSPAQRADEVPRTWRTNDRTSFGLFVLVVSAVLSLLFRSPTLFLLFGSIGAAFLLWGLLAQRRERRRTEFRS